MPRTHAFTASIGRLDPYCVLSHSHLDLLIALLSLFKLHRLHLNDHGAAIDSPQVEALFELRPVQLNESNLEVFVHHDAFSHSPILPLLEILSNLATKKSHEGSRCPLSLRLEPVSFDRRHVCLERMQCWLRFQGQLVMDVSELLLLFILTQSREALL